MQKAAEDSQSKSGNLGNGAAVYAFKIARINPENLSVRFWTLGGNVRRFNLACSEITAVVEQIDSAIADGDFCLWFDGARCSVPEKLLCGIRENLLVLAQPTANDAIHSSYNAVSGGSDANVVREGVSTPTKPKASARQGNASAARQNLISQKDTCADSDAELDDTAHTAQVSADFENQVAQIVGKELRKAVMPLLAEIDAIAALLNECALKAAASKPARKRNAGKSPTDWKTPISIKRGRTSVVVGSRKAS